MPVKGPLGWVTEHPFITGGLASGALIFALGGFGGGILRWGILRGSVNYWFTYLTEKGYKPVWIIPARNFRVVLVEPLKPSLLSVAPIVGTYDFYGFWVAPFTRFEESPPEEE